MTRHDESVSLRQMRDYAKEAIAMAAGRARADLDRDRQFLLAVLKLVEIVGEAANRVSQSTREAHPQAPWQKTVGTRNRLVHGYDTANHGVLWDIVTLDLPPLVAHSRRS